MFRLGAVVVFVVLCVASCVGAGDDDDADNDVGDDDDVDDDGYPDDDAFPDDDTGPGLENDFIEIPAGSFWMGCSESADPDCQEDEYPGREVYLSTYFIQKYEVSVDKYRECFDAGVCLDEEWVGRIGSSDCAISFIPWLDADAYCRWKGWRLPTEAQWEKAARGDDERIYPWGDQWEPTYLNWFDDLDHDGTYGDADGFHFTAPDMAFPEGKSPYGLFNMAGNVWEMTADWYDSQYYAYAPSDDPPGPEEGDRKVVKGGGWHLTFGDDPMPYRISDRDAPYEPHEMHDAIGFRCASVNDQ